MFVNVTPSKVGRFISSKLLTSDFHFLHGSLNSCAILYNIPCSQTYTMARILYKGGLDLYIGLEMLASAFSFNSTHFHNSVGYTHLHNYICLSWQLLSGWRIPFLGLFAQIYLFYRLPLQCLTIEILWLIKNGGKLMVAKGILTVLVDYNLFYCT